jgi:hypothetical protein
MSNCYYSGAGNGSNCYELYDKTRLAPDINVIQNAADEMVNSLGQKVDYWINTTTLSGCDPVYGEQPTSVFHGPKAIKMMVTLNESSLSLSKFGFNADDDVVGYLTYKTFSDGMSGDDIYTSLNQNIEPKAGDVFRLSEYGSDRQNGRSGKMFEITQRVDQNVGELNPLGGHYGWKIMAKRLDYSWQPNLPQETVNEQITNDSFYGKISSTITGEVYSNELSYDIIIDTESKEEVLDMSVLDTTMYGTYDLNSKN